MRELENYQRAWAEKDPEEKAREKERAPEAEKVRKEVQQRCFLELAEWWDEKRLHLSEQTQFILENKLKVEFSCNYLT